MLSQGRESKGKSKSGEITAERFSELMRQKSTDKDTL